MQFPGNQIQNIIFVSTMHYSVNYKNLYLVLKWPSELM